jgi:hypothetical protein
MEFRGETGLMVEKTNRCGGEVCVEQPDGSFSDAAIHEQILNGVDTYDFEMATWAKLRAQGVPVSVLDSVLPLKSRS